MRNMKIYTFLSFLLLLVTNMVMAENPITKPFTIKAGYQQTDLHGKAIELLSIDGDTKALNSFMIGLSYHSEISNYFSLMHELNFNMHGAEVQLNDDINGTYNSTLKMNSLQLQPLNFTFRIKGLQIYLGPYTSALLNASIIRKDERGHTYKDKTIFGTSDEETEENKYLQKIDFGATAGLSYEFNKTISLGIRYNHGLAPLFDNTTEQKSIKIYNKS